MSTVLLSAVVGSHAYGLATPTSDTDRRGVYAPPTEAFWGFTKPPTSVDGPEPEQLTWEVEHFCALALRSNPTVLDLLVSPHVEVCTPLGAELKALLPAFLSRRAAVSFERATTSQLARATAAAEPRWKQVMHAIRLTLVCHNLLRTGNLDVNADPHRDRLLAVKAGAVPLADCLAWAARLRTDMAATTSPLPEHPDTARVESWLVSVRRRSLTPG